MSLQEIERSHIRSGQEGFDREIDAASHRMVLDILQINQYTKPIESVTRELVSNGVDSIREKEIAIKILSGQAKPEDYYHNREGEAFEASKWDPDYYDLDHLDLTNSGVEIRYEEGEGQGFCDNFIVKDHGVGLGRHRLRGYFLLGYSTKRNSANAFGAFGLGAKASLSTGTDYYTMETVHNGKKFRFNCFSYKIDSLIPKFNLETGKENPSFNIGTEEKPYYAHYEEVDDKNYTIITTPVKRHNRNRYIQAVKSQLLYFEGVNFTYVTEEGSESQIDFQAKVLYNSENLLISNTRQFNKPHIVVVKEKGSSFGVSYGPVDFDELEMQTLFGSVGFKCPIRAVDRDPETGETTVISEGISVNPSRESVIWDSHTREYIQGIIKNAQEEASKLISEELQEEDFMEWVSKAHSVINNATNVSWGQEPTALSTLAKLVDKENLVAYYPKDKSIRFYQNPSTFFWGLGLRKVTTQYGKWMRNTNSHKIEIKRSPLDFWNAFKPDAIYKLGEDERASHVKDRFLVSLHNDSFLMIKPESREALLKEAIEDHKKWEESKVIEWVDKKIAIRDKIWSYLEPYTKAYSEVEVPETFEKKIEEEETKAKVAELSPAEKRALEGKVVCYTYAWKPASSYTYEYRLDKKEPILGSLDDIKHQVVYGTSVDDPTLKMLAEMHHNKERTITTDPDYLMMDRATSDKGAGRLYMARFSKRNIKHIKKNPNFIHVNKYLWNHQKTEYNVGTYFIPYFTSMYIKDRLNSLQFLRNFKTFNEPLSTAFNALEKYLEDNFGIYQRGAFYNNEVYKEFREQAEKGIEFQIAIRNGGMSEQAIKDLSKKLFDRESIKSANVIDESILTLVEELETFAENVKDLFNSVDYLRNSTDSIPDNAVRLISEILERENIEDFALSEASSKTLDNIS